MKRDMRKKALWLLGVGLAVFLVFGASARADDDGIAACGCKKITVEVTAHPTTPDPLGQYAGTALVTLGNKTFHADVVINPQGTPTFNEDGTIQRQIRSQCSIPELASTYECYEHATFTPVSGDPLRYTASISAVIFNGTGVFSESYGKLLANGVFSLADGIFSVVAEGRVCDVDLK